MRSEARRGREIQDLIREVLLRYWDPIGVAQDEEWPRDEYDAYIGEIYGFMARGETEEFIARHLCFIEDKLMGLGRVSVDARLGVAQRLKALPLQSAESNP
jgi:hypothetical protein